MCDKIKNKQTNENRFYMWGPPVSKGRDCFGYKNIWSLCQEKELHIAWKHPWQLIMESCWQWLWRQMLTCTPAVYNLGLMTRWGEGEAVTEWGQLAAGTLAGKGKLVTQGCLLDWSRSHQSCQHMQLPENKQASQTGDKMRQIKRPII